MKSESEDPSPGELLQVYQMTQYAPGEWRATEIPLGAASHFLLMPEHSGLLNGRPLRPSGSHRPAEGSVRFRAGSSGVWLVLKIVLEDEASAGMDSTE
jgi:hypothetical protein